MKSSVYFILGAAALMMASCGKQKQDGDVVSQRYVHKYGYAVSKDEFESKKYPGQVVTLLKNGVTITATYENGTLHGPCTHTYPHSQTVESYYLYNQGALVKQIYYDVMGMPVREEVQMSPSRYATTLWYSDGTPRSMEEYANEEILEGQYFTPANELEAKVEKGKGKRVRRDAQGVLLSRDIIDQGFITKREVFYTNGSPESVAYYFHGKLNGEKKNFTASGEPISVEEYVQGKLHGKATYYKNGAKYLEVHYLDGMKNGMESHYIDGDIISQEILWENDKRHGTTTYYVDGIAQVEYFYDGKAVSQEKWNELNHLDEMISQIAPEAKW